VKKRKEVAHAKEDWSKTEFEKETRTISRGGEK